SVRDRRIPSRSDTRTGPIPSWLRQCRMGRYPPPRVDGRTASPHAPKTGEPSPESVLHHFDRSSFPAAASRDRVKISHGFGGLACRRGGIVQALDSVPNHGLPIGSTRVIHVLLVLGNDFLVGEGTVLTTPIHGFPSRKNG